VKRKWAGVARPKPTSRDPASVELDCVGRTEKTGCASLAMARGDLELGDLDLGPFSNASSIDGGTVLST
jgi:hypothetical protein